LRKILLIAKRDFIASVMTKAFLVGLVIAPLLFGSGFLVLALLRSKPDITDKRIAIVDHTARAAAAVIQIARQKNDKELFDKKTGKQVAPHYTFETVTADDGKPDEQRLALSERVRSGELFAFIDIQRGSVSYYTNAGGLDTARTWLAGPVNDGLRRTRLSDLGVDPSHYDELLSSVTVQRMSLVSRDEKTGEIREARKKSEIEGVAAPYVLLMLLAMIVMASASPMLPAIAEDKMQRVFEMLLGSATPFELMAGKVLAAIGRSLTSSVFYVVGATLVLQGLALTGMAPFELLPWFFVYLIADVTVLAALAAALGAACSSPQDSQSLAIVLLSPVMIPLLIFMFVLQQPSSLLSTALSLFPPFTPLLMLVRQAMPGGVPAWQPWVGLVGIVAWTLVMTWAAARIFRVAVLMQGKTPNLAELLRWAVKG
jgi:ABC-2 type transport system permease protein